MLSTNNITRFNEQVKRTSNCWFWYGAISKDGYGIFCANGKAYRAHRVSYEIANGKILDGNQIHHVCEVKKCVNPEHLESVNHSTHPIRYWNAIKTHCNKGHPLSGDNLSTYDRQRVCKLCHNERNRKYRQKLRA